MIYGYLRVSTTSGEQLSALENQRQRIENAGCDVVLEDIQSGRDNDRPGYLKLLDAIGRGLATKVLVTRLDRLGRDAGEVDGMLAFAAKHRCRVEALDGGLIESESPSGFLLSRVMSSLAEMESRMLSQRIKAGLEVRRTLRAPLRSKSPWGYRKRADGLAFEPDPVEFPRAQQMIRLLREHSWRFHAALKAWKEQELGPLPINSGLSLSRWLHNPVLRGGVGYHRCSTKNFRETHWDCHTPLIDHGTFESARLQIESNRRRWGKNVRRQAHLLTGLCVCGHCGKRMRYICQDRAPGLYCRGPGCPYAFKDTKEPVIVAGINRALSARAEELGQLVAEESPELAQLRAEVERLQEFHDPDLEEAIQLKLRKMQNLHNLPPVDPELVKSLRQPGFWTVYSEAELRELYLLLVERVVIQDRQVLQVVCRF